MAISKYDYAAGTSITHSYPWGLYVTARVLCPDGKVRQVNKIAQTADTFFSVPAQVKAKGKSVSGYITTKELDSGGSVVLFHPVDTAKNADYIFPKRPFIKLSDLEFHAKYYVNVTDHKGNPVDYPYHPAVAKLERF